MSDRDLTDTEMSDARDLLRHVVRLLPPDVRTTAHVRDSFRILEEYARLLRRVIGFETRMVEGPRPLPVPRTWAEIEELVTPIGLTAWPMFNAFARAAYRPDVPPHVQIQAAAGVALRLREEFDPSSFPPPDESDFVKAWATGLGGVILKPEYTDEERELVEHPFVGGEA